MPLVHMGTLVYTQVPQCRFMYTRVHKGTMKKWFYIFVQTLGNLPKVVCLFRYRLGSNELVTPRYLVGGGPSHPLQIDFATHEQYSQTPWSSAILFVSRHVSK